MKKITIRSILLFVFVLTTYLFIQYKSTKEITAEPPIKETKMETLNGPHWDFIYDSNSYILMDHVDKNTLISLVAKDNSVWLTVSYNSFDYDYYVLTRLRTLKEYNIEIVGSSSLQGVEKSYPVVKLEYDFLDSRNIVLIIDHPKENYEFVCASTDPIIAYLECDKLFSNIYMK